MKKILIILICLILSKSELSAQCGYCGGAAIGGLAPSISSANIGLLRKGNFRASTFLVFAEGDEYYNGSRKIAKDANEHPVDLFKSSILGFNIGYGINRDITAELEIYSFLNQRQDFFGFDSPHTNQGLSHIAALLKYNIVSLRTEQIEWTIGAGGKIPLSSNTKDIPQYVQPSSGSYGIIAQSFFYKGFAKGKYRFMATSRFEHNFENSLDFAYGKSFVNSILFNTKIVEQLSTILELKYENRSKNIFEGNKQENTGATIISIAPYFVYNYKEFAVSAFVDYPIYNNYNGAQLTRKYSVGTSISWQTDLLRKVID